MTAADFYNRLPITQVVQIILILKCLFSYLWCPVFCFQNVTCWLLKWSSSSYGYCWCCLLGSSQGNITHNFKKTFHSIIKPQVDECFQHIHYKLILHIFPNSILILLGLPKWFCSHFVRSNFKICPQNLILSIILTNFYTAHLK